MLTTDDLVAGNDVFFAATGITDGDLLRGVKYWPDGATTYSMVMRSRSGTVRYVEAQHRVREARAVLADRVPPLGREGVDARPVLADVAAPAAAGELGEHPPADVAGVANGST